MYSIVIQLYMYMYILSNSFPHRLLQNTEYSSLCYTVGPHYLFYICMSLHSCHFTHVRLFATLWTVCSPLESSVHGILQARILEWVAISSSRGFSQPRDRTHVSHASCIGKQVLYHYCHLGSPVL